MSSLYGVYWYVWVTTSPENLLHNKCWTAQGFRCIIGKGSQPSKGHNFAKLYVCVPLSSWWKHFGVKCQIPWLFFFSKCTTVLQFKICSANLKHSWGHRYLHGLWSEFMRVFTYENGTYLICYSIQFTPKLFTECQWTGIQCDILFCLLEVPEMGLQS